MPPAPLVGSGFIATYPSPEEIARAREFLLERWREHAAERGDTYREHLAGACMFAALFSQGVFGGITRANWHHCWVELCGEVLDLTGEDGLDEPVSPYFAGRHGQWAERRYQHDPVFFEQPEFRERLVSCHCRAADWAMTYCIAHGWETLPIFPGGVPL